MRWLKRGSAGVNENAGGVCEVVMNCSKEKVKHHLAWLDGVCNSMRAALFSYRSYCEECPCDHEHCITQINPKILNRLEPESEKTSKRRRFRGVCTWFPAHSGGVHVHTWVEPSSFHRVHANNSLW